MYYIWSRLPLRVLYFQYFFIYIFIFKSNLVCDRVREIEGEIEWEREGVGVHMSLTLTHTHTHTHTQKKLIFEPWNKQRVFYIYVKHIYDSILFMLFLHVSELVYHKRKLYNLYVSILRIFVSNINKFRIFS